MFVGKLGKVNQKRSLNSTLKKEEITKPVDAESKKIDKKKLAIGISAAVGMSALVVGGILYAKHGQASTKLQEGIKNFIDNNGNKIEGIKLEKGKAVASDGSMFSGLMETTTKSGKKVSIQYQNGFMTQSKIDGKLFKKFENITIPAKDGKIAQTLSRNQGTRIIKYDSAGNFNEMFEHLYHDNGKIKRTVSETKATDFFSNGKIQAYEVRKVFRTPNENGWVPQSLSEYTAPHSTQLYNQKGVLTDEFFDSPSGKQIIKYLPDGSRAELTKVGYVNNELPLSTTLVSERKFTSGNAKIFDAEGKLKSTIFKSYSSKNETDSLNVATKSGMFSCDIDGKYPIIAGSLDDHLEFAMDKNIYTLYDKGTLINNPEEKVAKLKQCIEFIKKEISNAREIGIDGADRISELLPEFLKKFE